VSKTEEKTHTTHNLAHQILLKSVDVSRRLFKYNNKVGDVFETDCVHYFVPSPF